MVWEETEVQDWTPACPSLRKVKLLSRSNAAETGAPRSYVHKELPTPRPQQKEGKKGAMESCALPACP